MALEPSELQSILEYLSTVSPDRLSLVALQIWRGHPDSHEALGALLRRRLGNHAPLLIEQARAQLGSGNYLSEHLEQMAAAFMVEAAPVVESLPVEDQRERYAVAAVQAVQAVRVDPELARIAIGLHQVSQLRFWLLARHVITEKYEGRGWIDRQELFEALANFDVSFTRRHFNRRLAEGEGLYWRIDRQTKRVYIGSIVKVSRLLVETAAESAPELVLTNVPAGVRKPVLLPISDTHEQWEARIYAGWLAARRNPTIARATLESLFGRGADTLRRWEKTRLVGIVDVTPTFAQVSQEAIEYGDFTGTPEHATPYIAITKNRLNPELPPRFVKRRIRFQLPNTYMVNEIGQHNHAGQSRRVRAAVNRALGVEPLHYMPEGNRPARQKLYFHSGLKLKRTFKKYGRANRYLFIGFNKRGHAIFEVPANGFAETTPDERLPRAAEARIMRRDALRGAVSQ
jgi:hypothetical protein